MNRHRLLLLLVLVPLLAVAALPPAVGRADGPSDDHVRRVASQLQCPVCPGESVANSEAELAQQMRAHIRARLTEGWTDEQILQYYVDRYGEAILLNPPKWGFTALIWLGVVAAVALGVVVVASTLVDVLRRRGEETAAPIPAPGMADDERARYAARLEQLLQGDRRG